MAKSSARSVRTKDDPAQHSPGRAIVVGVVWVAAAAAWAFVLASLMGYHRNDPPTYLIAPASETVQNWCGPTGAAIAAFLLNALGWSAWVLTIAVGILLLIPATRRRVPHLVLRTVGALMVTAALAGFNALVLPGSGPMNQAGGMVGRVLDHELVARFGSLGAGLWLGLMLAIGAIVALDRLLLTIPRWAAQRSAPALRGAASKAASGTGTAVRSTGGGLRAALARMVERTRPRVRLDDLEDDDRIERPEPSEGVSPKRSRTAVRNAERLSAKQQQALDAEAVALAEPTSQPASAPAEPDDDDELPGAPQVYDEDALRAKVAKLPVRFSGASRTLATEADLSDLQNEAELEGYRFPGLDLLSDPEEDFSKTLEGLVRGQAEALEGALQQFRIQGEVVGIESGPVITLYQVRLAPGVRASALQTVASDIARALRAVNIRIVPNQAGLDTVGVEVPNPTKEKVRLKELMSNRESFAEMRLPMFLGKDASGEPLIADLTTMPHMLIAGTTGSGKSVCMNTIIMSFLYTKKPNELKLVLVDPKMVEMSQFKDIPHLMCPVVTEMPRAAAILEWACTKMDERYELLAEAGCRDIAAYNAMDWEDLKEAFDPPTPQAEARIPRRLPYMVFIIDELADLMMTNKEVEGSIIRIAQKARAVGIHLILATQRPQANVVTGLIKSNMPCRVSFKVASGMDSRIVLDQKGGELLLGQGDMLFLSPSSHKLVRSQGTLVDDREIRRVVRFMREIARPSFERQLIQLRSLDDDEARLEASENNSSASLAAAQEDPMFDRAVEIVLETKRGSVSLLQRRLAIGYTRASRLIDLMGIAGIIGEHKGSVAREVMITPEDWEAMKRLAAEAQDQQEQQPQTELFPEPDPPPAEPTDPASSDEPPPFETDQAVVVHAIAQLSEDDQLAADQLDADDSLAMDEDDALDEAWAEDEYSEEDLEDELEEDPEAEDELDEEPEDEYEIEDEAEEDEDDAEECDELEEVDEEDEPEDSYEYEDEDEPEDEYEDELEDGDEPEDELEATDEIEDDPNGSSRLSLNS